MELRKDPITRSWVITGDDVPDSAPRAEAFAGFVRTRRWRRKWFRTCREWRAAHGRRVPWSIPLRCIGSRASRPGAAMASTIACAPVGAHEVLVENPRHDRQSVERERCGD